MADFYDFNYVEFRRYWQEDYFYSIENAQRLRISVKYVMSLNN